MQCFPIAVIYALFVGIHAKLVLCVYKSSYKLGKEWRIAAFYYFCYTVSHYKTSYKGYLQMKKPTPKPGLIVQSKGKY